MYIDVGVHHDLSVRNSQIVKYGKDRRSGDNHFPATFSVGREALPKSSDILLIMKDFCFSYEEALSTVNLLLFTRIDPDIPQLTVDNPLLIQRLLHDLSEYSLRQAARGCVVLDLKARRESEYHYSISITLTMSGNGIPRDKEKDIFMQRRESEQNMLGGTTVANLYYAREICRRYNGDISVRNSFGFGTRFMVKLCLPCMDN